MITTSCERRGILPQTGTPETGQVGKPLIERPIAEVKMMQQWDERFEGYEEWLIERTQKAWEEFEAYVSKRKADRDKALDEYLEARNGNGTVSPHNTD